MSLCFDIGIQQSFYKRRKPYHMLQNILFLADYKNVPPKVQFSNSTLVTYSKRISCLLTQTNNSASQADLHHMCGVSNYNRNLDANANQQRD